MQIHLVAEKLGTATWWGGGLRKGTEGESGKEQLTKI